MQYSQYVRPHKTPQSEPIPGETQVQNSAGGYVYEINPMKRIERFLILGTEGGTYYTNERKLTVENAQTLIHVLKTDPKSGPYIVGFITGLSDSGRAVKNDPAIFALALCCTYGDTETKKFAYQDIHKVCRTGTHLFTFCQSIQDLRGWSRGLRNGVAQFYLKRTQDDLSYQLIKYRQRNGWTHKDVLRLSHPKSDPKSETLEACFRFATGKESDYFPPKIEAFRKIQDPNRTLKEVCSLIQEHKLPWEAVPTTLLTKPEIWEALLDQMPLTAMIRNLGKMTSIGLFQSSLDSQAIRIIGRLTDSDQLKKARIHPLTLYTALKTYSQGYGDKGKLTWKPVSGIIEALETGFEKSFGLVQPSNKRTLLALDVSGSMGSYISNLNISCREAAALMALVTKKRETYCDTIAFTATTDYFPIRRHQSLNEVIQQMFGLHFGATDCAQPMLFALKHGIQVDHFIVYTDNETWIGSIHPTQALRQYREKTGIPAKLSVVGMTATKFSIADPHDPGMMDFVGFDTATPQALTEFAKA